MTSGVQSPANRGVRQGCPSLGSTLIVGLGNPILGDDGVGWCIAETVRQALDVRGWLPNVELDCFALGGLSLMERLVGYDRVIIIDALQMGSQPGTLGSFRLEELPNFSSANSTSVHDTSLQNALRLGRQMGAHLPEEVLVVGVEAHQLYDFSEELSPEVAAAVEPAAQMVLKLLFCE